MSKIRISLSQQGDDIKGTIETPGDAAFVLEALALVIEHVAERFEVAPDEVARDLFSMVTGVVK